MADDEVGDSGTARALNPSFDEYHFIVVAMTPTRNTGTAS